MNPNSGSVFHYKNLSKCEMDWDSIAVLSAGIRIEAGPNFVLEGIWDHDIDGPGSPWDTGDDDAEVEGNVTLIPGKCYINLGVHSAFDNHITGDGIHRWIAFSFSPPRCA